MFVLRTLFRALGVAALLCASVSAAVVPAPPRLGVRAYILMDAGSGQIIAADDADMAVEPASLTKIMTVFVAAEELSGGRLTLDETALISDKAYRTGGSKMFVEVNERVSIDDLLQGIIVQSGNDASVALAEHLAGTEDVFASMMNQSAAELGLSKTRFHNATGLPHPEHVTTARDLALLSRALIARHPDIYARFQEKEFTWAGIKQTNRNRLLFLDPSVDGIKTGHTEAAGYCLVASAYRDGMRLVSVVLGGDSVDARTNDSRALLEYGFRFFEGREVYAAGAPVLEQPLWKGRRPAVPLGFADPVRLTFPRGRYDEIAVEVDVPEPLLAPVAAGAEIGSTRFMLDGEPILTAPLIALEDVPRGGLWRRTVDSIRLMLP